MERFCDAEKSLVSKKQIAAMLTAKGNQLNQLYKLINLIASMTGLKNSRVTSLLRYSPYTRKTH